MPVPSMPFPGRNNARSQKSLAAKTRELVGGDGEAIIKLWWSIANDPMQKASDRNVALRELADRGWGKAAGFVAQEGDPLGLENIEAAAEAFDRNVLRLVDAQRAERVDRPRSPSRVDVDGGVADVSELPVGDVGASGAAGPAR